MMLHCTYLKQEISSDTIAISITIFNPAIGNSKMPLSTVWYLYLPALYCLHHLHKLNPN